MPEPTKPFLEPNEVIKRLELVPGMMVGDFGVGGAGAYAIPMSRQVAPSGGVIMFDIQKTALSGALSMARVKGVGNCRAVWSNLEVYGGAKGVPEKSLDAGLVVNVLHQSHKYQDILAEIHRMLKVGTKLMVIDWQPEAVDKLAPPKSDRLADVHVEQVAMSLGFAPFERFDAGAYHWGLILVKT